MKPSICHYSYHNTWTARNWDCNDLAEAVRAHGVGAIDFHVRFLEDPKTAPERIRTALSKSGLELSGISLSNNLYRNDPAEFEKEIADTIEWIQVAAEVEAPASRIFGGHIKDRSDEAALEAAFNRIVEGLGRVTEAAEKYGVILALENHGGLPCTAEEQIDVIRKINSDHLRATVDIGNYMSCGQNSADATAISAQYAAYVHVKDFATKKSTNNPWGWETEAAVLGAGVVDVPACLSSLKDSGYDGFVALEYEAATEEEIGVTESIEYLKSVLETL